MVCLSRHDEHNIPESYVGLEPFSWGEVVFDIDRSLVTPARCLLCLGDNLLRWLCRVDMLVMPSEVVVHMIFICSSETDVVHLGRLPPEVASCRNVADTTVVVFFISFLVEGLFLIHPPYGHVVHAGGILCVICLDV